MWVEPAHLFKWIKARGNGHALLALDVGAAYCGLAVTDTGWARTKALRVLQRKKRSLRAMRRDILDTCDKHNVGGMVVGWPLLPDTGEAGLQCARVASFIRDLDIDDIPKVHWDEQYSTAMIQDRIYESDTLDPRLEAKLRRRQMPFRLDSYSAELVLKDFLSEHGRQRRLKV